MEHSKYCMSLLILLVIGNPRLTSATVPSSCNDDTDIILAAGTSAYGGIVQLCINNEWLAACGDHWGQLETNAACRQLGFTESGDVIGNYSEGALSPTLNCSQEETELIKCLTDRGCKGSTSPRILCSQPSTSRITRTSNFLQPTSTINTIHSTMLVPQPTPEFSLHISLHIDDSMKDMPTVSSPPTISPSETPEDRSSSPPSYTTNSNKDIDVQLPDMPTVSSPPTISPSETPEDRSSSPPSYTTNSNKDIDGYPLEAVAFLAVGLLLTAVTVTGIVIALVAIIVMRARQKQLVPFAIQRYSHENEDMEVHNTIYTNSDRNVECDDLEKTDEGSFTKDSPVYQDIKSTKQEAKECLRSQRLLDSAIFDDNKYSSALL